MDFASDMYYLIRHSLHLNLTQVIINITIVYRAAYCCVCVYYRHHTILLSKHNELIVPLFVVAIGHFLNFEIGKIFLYINN